MKTYEDVSQRIADRAYVFLNGRVACEALGDAFRGHGETVGHYLGICSLPCRVILNGLER